MEYQVKLNNGDKFNVVDENLKVLEFTEKINNQQIAYVSIGDSVINKHSFVSAVPVKSIADNELNE